MIFFITIIFIAQVIIVWNIANFLIVADTKINAAIIQTESYAQILPELMEILKEATSDIKYHTKAVIEDLKKHKNRFIIRKIRLLLESGLFVLLRPRYKKLVLGLRFGTKVTKKLVKVAKIWYNKTKE